MNRLVSLSLLLGLGLSSFNLSKGAVPKAHDRDTLYQTSTLDALMKGLYDGNTTFATLKRHGDFSIGTVNTLDGEMVGLDGRFYQIRSNGQAYPVPDSARTPFAVVTYFDADLTLPLMAPMDYPALEKALDKVLPSKNEFYAIRIDGTFATVKTRSVPRQKRPYPPLLQVTKTQPTFDFHNVKGTLVGFRCPDFAKGVNLPGYHFHFLTEDRKAGGHILSLTVGHATARLDMTPGFQLALPTDAEFMKADLTPSEDQALQQAEKARK